MTSRERLLSAVQDLIKEGIQVQETMLNVHQRPYADVKLFSQWLPGCRNLMRILGTSANAFNEPFEDAVGFSEEHRCHAMLGALKALEVAISKDLLQTVQELVFAEAFTDLLEQAEELSEKGYSLAAGVICRAVFEEHLRKLCDVNRCLPPGKPTIDPLKQELVKAGVFTKIDAKNVDAIAGEGNHCAHNNQPPLTMEQIKGLIQKLQSFLIQHPLK
jgi:hypothetical protein